MKSICNTLRTERIIDIVKHAVRNMMFRIEQVDLWMEHRVEEIITRWEKEQNDIN